MAKVKGSIKAMVKRSSRPVVKAGRTMPKNVGGILNAKVAATVKKIKEDG